MTILPYLIQSAHSIVTQFLRDWQHEPYRWDYERDVQMELAARLTTFCRLIGQDTLEGYYPAYVVPGYPIPQRWARVV